MVDTPLSFGAQVRSCLDDIIAVIEIENIISEMKNERPGKDHCSVSLQPATFVIARMVFMFHFNVSLLSSAFTILQKMKQFSNVAPLSAHHNSMSGKTQKLSFGI